MSRFALLRGGKACAILLSAIAFIAGSSAHAASTTCPTTVVDQVCVTDYIVIQPIDVCNDTGPSGTSGCAPFNTLSASPDPSKATATTPIGFVDGPTNANLTRAIWLQSGIDVTFLPILEYNDTLYQDIDDITQGCSTCTLTSTKFQQLSTGSGTSGTNPNCKSDCSDPRVATPPPTATSPNAINMFFVNSITGSASSPVAVGSLSGFGWINNNGVAIASDVFSFSSLVPSRFDTLGHELGHNLNLDHTTFGAGTLCKGTPSPQGCNAMDAGTLRVVPDASGCSSTSSSLPTGGLLFDLDTSLCGTSVPKVPQADQLILGTSTGTQQGQVLLSGFMNPIPSVNATAGGGDVAFTVTFPKLNQAGGRSNEYIFALVLALPSGFQFGPNLFTQTGGTAQVFSFEKLNGNNGQGNTNCLKPLNGAPSIQCLEIDFVPGTFTANTSVSFTSDIVFKNGANAGLAATAADLQCTPPAPGGCLDLTYAFSDLLATSSAFVADAKTGVPTANSQLPDAAVSSTIITPAGLSIPGFPSVSDFPSVANLNPPLQLSGFSPTPCSPAGATSCPAKAGGVWGPNDE